MQHADIYIIEVPKTTKIDENGEEVEDATKVIPFMTDAYSAKNSTFFFSEDEFRELLVFAQTRKQITSGFELKYLVKCEEFQGKLRLYLTIWTAYLILFLSLFIYNLAKYRDGFNGLVEQVAGAIQGKLLALMFLLGFKASINWFFLGMCPWELENTRNIDLAEKAMNATQILVETFFAYMMLLIAIGYGVIKARFTMDEMGHACGLPGFRFFFTQIFGTFMLTFDFMISTFIVIMVIYDMIVLVIIGFYMNETLKRIRMCLASLQNDPLHRHIRD